MQSVYYERARDAADALRLAQQEGARFIGGGGLRIGVGVRNADAARHAAVRQRCPLLAQAMLDALDSSDFWRSDCKGFLLASSRAQLLLSDGVAGVLLHF